MKVIIHKKKKEKPVINRNTRDYNIINNRFMEDHENR